MSAEPDVGMEEGLKDEKLATAMQDQLSKEAASWSKERRQQSSETVIVPPQPVVQQHSPRPAAKSKSKSASVALPAEPASARSKPFSMSYAGMTQAQYVQYLLDRGSA